MTMRMRIGAGLMSVAAMVSLGSLPLGAQEPGSRPDEAKPARKGSSQARRVPRYFGQVGLTPDQKEQIYRIKETHMGKIEALKQQIAEAEAKMMAECEGVLTEAQRRLLEQRRGTARGRSRTEAADGAGSLAGSNP